MKRCFGSYGFVLAVAVLGSLLQTLAVAAAGDSSWTSAAGVPDPQNYHFEGSLAKTGDQSRQYRWIPEAKIPTPFGYSLVVTALAKNDQNASREPIALLSPDLAYLAIGSDSGEVQIVDRMEKQKTTSFLPIRQITKRQPDAARGVQDLAFYRSGDKMTLIVADGGSELTLWDAAAGNQLASLAHGQAGDRIAFAPGPKDSLIVAIGSQLRKCDYALKKWDAPQQKLPAPIIAIAASEYRRVVAVATADRSITLFDGETLKPLQSWKHSDGKINTKLQISLAVSLKGDRVFTTTSESQGTVAVWDAKTGKKTGSFTHSDSDGIPGKFLRLSATLEGKVETQWVRQNGYGNRALLWSPPEGVEFMPPAGLWLVHAKAVKVLSNDGGWETSEWEILHAYTGDPNWKGKSFRLTVLSVLGTTFDRIKGYSVLPGDEDIWWIRRKAEGELVGELGLQLLRYDPECAFPGSPFKNQMGAPNNQLQSPSKALAVMIEKLNDCNRDSERVRLLVKNVAPDSVNVSSWSLWWLEPATFRAKVPIPDERLSARKLLESEKQFKLKAASGAVERVAKHASSPGDFYNVACSMSLCVRLSAVESDQESSARRAVAYLEQAIEKGWDDVERVKNDADLDSVRARYDFKKLLAVLEARKARQPSKMK